jgi:hypothetical protein
MKHFFVPNLCYDCYVFIRGVLNPKKLWKIMNETHWDSINRTVWNVIGSLFVAWLIFMTGVVLNQRTHNRLTDSRLARLEWIESQVDQISEKLGHIQQFIALDYDLKDLRKSLVRHRKKQIHDTNSLHHTHVGPKE